MKENASSGRGSGAVRRGLAVGVTVLACLLWTPPAQAHVELVGSTPAAGDVVSLDTTEMVLAFGDDLLRGAADVVVRDQKGTDVVVGDPAVAGRSVEVEIAMTEPGHHEVSYRVVGLDGHPIVGSYSFNSARPRLTVARGASADETAARRTATGGKAPRGTSTDDGVPGGQATSGAAGPALATATVAAPDDGVAWLPWALGAGTFVGLLLVLRGVTGRTSVARAGSRATR